MSFITASNELSAPLSCSAKSDALLLAAGYLTAGTLGKRAPSPKRQPILLRRLLHTCQALLPPGCHPADGLDNHQHHDDE